MLENNARIIKQKVGLLNLAEELGNVSKACKVMGRTFNTHRVGIMPIRFSLGLIAACFFAFRLFFAHLDIEPQAIDILKRWVSSEYVRHQTGRDDIGLSEKAELISQAQTIEFKSWHVRGTPERMVFRIEIAPNSARPPNTPNIRYFRLDHSLVLGWTGSVPRRADAFTYFLALFMV